MKQHKLTTSYTARYFTLGDITPATRHLWFVCHGYGQLAAYFIKNFSVLNNGKHYIVAPEGLSRFYLTGFSGRVGATWMTKEDRHSDIENYLQFLDTTYHEVMKEMRGKPVSISLLGFSQGAATVSRWATRSAIHFDHLILWAGIFPPDLDFTTGKERMKGKKSYLIYGKNDPYLNTQRLKEQDQLVERLGIVAKTLVFEGKHEINTTVLQQLEKQISG